MATFNELVMDTPSLIYFANDSDVGCTSLDKYINEKGIEGIKNHPALKGYVAYKISTMDINGKIYKLLTIVYVYPERGEHYHIAELVFNGKPATAAQLRKLNSSLGYI